MLIISLKLHLLLLLQLFSCSPTPTKPKLTFDEFFDYTIFPFLKFSPNGQYLLIETSRPSWNTSTYENTLWIYDTQQHTRKVITKNPHKLIKPQWSPNGNWIALLLEEPSSNKIDQRLLENEPPTEQQIYLYSLMTNDLSPIHISKNIPLAFAWSDNDFSLYLAAIDLQAIKENDDLDKDEWKDVIQYRHNTKNVQSTIYRIDINHNNNLLSVKRNVIRNVSFLIGELLFVPLQAKLLCTSISLLLENVQDFEIYSIDLWNTSSLVRLTDNEAVEGVLRLSIDGQHVLFQTDSAGSTRGKSNATQARLLSLNLLNGQITRLAENFHGNIIEFIVRSDGGVYIVGQLGTEMQIYSQRSSRDNLIKHSGWNGTYGSITSSYQNRFIAFVHSSTANPMEVYFINNIDQLQLAQAITDENKLFTQRDLP